MNKLQMCLHTGGYEVPLEKVAEVPTPPPDGAHHPISHKMLYEQIVMALGNLNMRVVAEQHALAKDGQRYFAMMQIANGKEDDDYSWVLGLRNSHDRSYSAGLVCGSGVFVCDNLSFSGEIRIARKHTRHIERDLPILTTRAVGRLSQRWVDMDRRFESYKGFDLNDVTAHDLTIRALDCGALNTTQIPKVLEEWRHPRHPEFSENKSVWRYFNACTEVMKDNSVFMLPKRTESLHALLDARCGFIGEKETITDISTEGTVDSEVVVRN